MRSVAVSWDPAGDRFVALGSHARHPISINAPRLPEETRGSTGFSATELLLAGAGACSAWDVVEILRKRRHDITSLDVRVEGEQAAEPPWQYERIVLHWRVAGSGLSRPVMERVIRLACLRYCSVLATVSGVARLEATLELLDADGNPDGVGRRPVTLPSRGDSPVIALDTDESLVDED